MILHSLFVALLLALAVGVARAPRPAAERVTRALASRWAPWAAGAVTMAFYWWLTAEWTPYARVHDEASYLLQAQTFARFRWVNPSPPIPEFFEQYHVFVVPAFFGKYPPGHAIAMVPGIWLGLPALVPMLLNGVAGGLLYALARRLANPWVAALTFALWLGAEGNLRFRPSYFSEATSSAAWLAGWWALLEWRASRRRGWLLALAACTGWMAITRPLTAAAYAVPIALVCLWDVVRHRLWRDAALAFVAGSAVVALMPLWSVQSLGQARPSPYSLYSDIYFPYDKPGFGVDTTPPRRALTDDMKVFASGMRLAHVGYEPEVLPAAYLARTKAVLVESLRPAVVPLMVLAAVGLVAAGAAGVFATISALGVLAAYLAFAHPTEWTVYYVETEVVAPFLAALGAWTIVAAARARGWPGRAALDALPPRAALVGLVLVVPVLVELAALAPHVRENHARAQLFFKSVQATVARLPGARKIVFVRYAPQHNPHNTLITNEADLPGAPVWWVYDRGAENARLTALAPDRVPYLLDEAISWVGPLERARPAPGAVRPEGEP